MPGLVLDPIEFMDGMSAVQPGDIGAIKEALDADRVAEFGEWVITNGILCPSVAPENGLVAEAEYSPYSLFRDKTGPATEVRSFGAELTPFIPADGTISARRLRSFAPRVLPTRAHQDRRTEDYRLVIPIQNEGTLVHKQHSSDNRHVRRTRHHLSIGDVGVINNLCPVEERAAHYTRTRHGVVWFVIGKFGEGKNAVQHY